MTTNTHNTTGGLTNIDLPQYSAHLGHNNLLRPHVLAEVAKARVGPLEELRFLQGEMKVLNIVLDALQRRKELVEDLLWAYDTLLAPIRRLPDDTLEEIFYHCLPTTRNARPFVSEAPLLLTLVCKKWRTVALAAPRLWSTLHIPSVFNYHPAFAHPFDSELGLIRPNNWCNNIPDPTLKRIPQIRLSELQIAREGGLNKWLRRSGSLPISISLHAYQSFSRFNIHSQTSSGLQDQAALDLIARYADRLSTLEVKASLNLLEELGRAIMRYFSFTTLPRLRQLRVSINSDPHSTSVSETSNSLSMFFSAKSLQQLVVNPLHRGKTTSILHSVSSTITVLSLHTFSDASPAHCVLRNLHKLEQCHISIDYFDNRRFPADPAGSNLNAPQSTVVKPVHSTIYLPALNTLSMCGPLLALQDLCEPLDVPSLLTLHLRILPKIAAVYHLPAGADTWVLLSPGVDATDSGQDRDDLPYLPPAKPLSAFLAQCTSLRSLKINPCSSGITPGELHFILSSLPHIASLVLNNDAADVTVNAHPVSGPQHVALATLTSMRYALQLLLQRDVSSKTGDTMHPDHFEGPPLLPNLTSITWIQSPSSHMQIPNNLLVEVIKNRLYSSHEPSMSSPTSLFGPHQYQHPSEAPVAPLKEIKIRLLVKADALDIETQLLQHAQLMGLQRGVHFNLDISVHPPPKQGAAQVPRYVIPKGYTYKTPIFATEDNLDIESEMTWPLEL